MGIDRGVLAPLRYGRVRRVVRGDLAVALDDSWVSLLGAHRDEVGVAGSEHVVLGERDVDAAAKLASARHHLVAVPGRSLLRQVLGLEDVIVSLWPSISTLPRSVMRVLFFRRTDGGTRVVPIGAADRFKDRRLSIRNAVAGTRS